MMKLNNKRDTFIFLCERAREDKKACNNNGYVPYAVNYLRETIKAHKNEYQKGRVIKVHTSGCLGKCKYGPNLVIFPESIWYNFENEQDLDEIIKEHIINGKIVKRLLTKMPEQDGLSCD